MSKTKDSEEFLFSTTLDFTNLNLENYKALPRDGFRTSDDNFKAMKYSRLQVRSYLSNPAKNEKVLREISRYLFISSSHYFRLINYLSKMLILIPILVPLNAERINKDSFPRAYNKVVSYLENYNINNTLQEIINILVLEDVYFGVERWNKNSFVMQRLPSDHCKITGIENGLYTFSFDFSFFDSRKTDENSDPIDIIQNYPEEFVMLYKQYKKTRKKWQKIPSEYSACFKFNKETLTCIPPFVSLYEEIMDIEDQKESKKLNSKNNNFKLIQQKIPLKKEPKSENDMVFTPDTVRMFHQAIKASLPDGIAIISSPMELETVDFERKVGTRTYDDINAEDDLFNHAGIAKPLFAGGENNSISLNRSIEMDESLMFSLLRQFELYFKLRLDIFSSNYKFKIIFPDITVYNREKMLDKMISLGQNGLPKSLIFAVAGYSLNDIHSLNVLENTYLDILKDMQPLKTSHVQSKSEGRPQEDIDDLTGGGLKDRETGASKKKAK